LESTRSSPSLDGEEFGEEPAS